MGKLDPEKITVDENVKIEAARMDKVSVNKNPSLWMDPATLGLKVCSLNTLSLRKHIEDVKSDPILMKSDVLCLQETWLEDGEEKDEKYQMEGFIGHFVSVGRGKGLAVYVKREQKIGRVSKFGESNIQMIKIEVRDFDIIAIYRSKEEPPTSEEVFIFFIITSVQPSEYRLTIISFSMYCKNIVITKILKISHDI